MVDSQTVYSEMVAERKTEESISYDSKKHRGSMNKNIPHTTGYAFLAHFGVCFGGTHRKIKEYAYPRNKTLVEIDSRKTNTC